MIFQIPTHPLEYVLIVPKALASIFFLITALKIYSLHKEFTLNKICLFMYLSFSIYLFLDIFVYIFAPYSDFALYIANILFKIQIVLLVVYMYSLYLASMVIKTGDDVLHLKRTWIIGGILVILTLLTLIFKIIVVLDENGNIITNLPPTEEGFKATNGTKEGFSDFLTLIFSAVPVLLDFYALALFIDFRTKLDPQDPKRKQIRFFIIGNLLIPLGLIYFVIQSIIALHDYGWILAGYAFWLIAPYFLWISQIGKKE